MNTSTAVTLTSERLLLHPMRAEDVDDAHRLWTDPDVRRYLWDDVVIARELAAEVVEASCRHFSEHGYGLWWVHRHDDPDWIGFCGFRPSKEGEPELLYGLLPAAWGQGLAQEASRTVLAYLFDQLGHEKVVAATDFPNTASVRVLERLGMTFERRGLLNGLDTVFYSLERRG